MTLYEVFSYSLRLRYKANFCSKTTLFYLLIKILTLILPIVIIYFEGCLRSVNQFREQPDVSFKHKMIVLLETDNLDDLIFWSTYKTLNELIPFKLQKVIPTIKHREEDYNRDKKHDEMVMNIEFPIQRKKILSVKLLLIFDYKLYQNINLQMECASYIHQSSPLPGSSLFVTGDLNLVQREPLNYKGRNAKYNVSVVDETNKDESFLTLEKILLQYARKNVSTSLVNQYSVWKSGHTENKPFIIDLHIKYPEQTILYKAQLWELIKMFIVQYIAFFAIFSYVFYKIKFYVFKKQLVPTTVLSPIKRD